MEVVNLKIKELKPYEKNSKKHDKIQIDNVAESIKQFGMVQPIVVDKNNTVIIGHCRLEACKKLKMKEVPCVKLEDLSEEQVKKLRLLDNKLNESDWDFELLQDDILGLDFNGFEIDWGLEENISQELEDDINNPYTKKVDVPQYQMTGECPKLEELVNKDKVNIFIEEINKSNVTEEQKKFLIDASMRHLVFDYGKIAEYYAHQNKEMQELMEKSALVIIDFNDAIKNGFVEIRKEIDNIINESEEDE